MIRANNLFELHDQHGVPLSVSVMLCVQYGVTPNLAKFFFDGVRAGWPPETVVITISSACRDNEYTFDETKFRELCVAWWERCDKSLKRCSEELND